MDKLTKKHDFTNKDIENSVEIGKDGFVALAIKPS